MESKGNNELRLSQKVLREKTETIERLLIAEKIFENVSEGIIVTDIDGHIIYVNPAFSHITGYGEDEIVGKSTGILNSGRHSKEYFQRMWQSLKSDGKWRGEIWNKRKNGEVYPEWLSINSFYDYSGKTTHYVGIFTDITDRKKTEDMLRLYARMFESSIEGIMITDNKGRIIDVNPAFEETTGHSKEAVLNKYPKILQSGKHEMTFYIDMWSEIHEKGRWQGEIWNKRKNGEIYPEWLSINVVKDDEGRIVNYVGIFTDITERKQAEDKLTHLAHYDMLTQLPNRYLFNQRLNKSISEAYANNKQLALLFLDLDRFKLVNDTLGHSVGDKLLFKAAQRLKECVREEDSVSRLGGDEFTIILKNFNSIEDVMQVVNRIFSVIERPFYIDKQELHMTTSIGISIYPNDAVGSERLIRNADTAMYRAKEDKGNNYAFFNVDMNNQLSERMRVENALRKALEREELSLFYQPQIDIESGEIVGAEALLRWNHSERGFISPVQFIPIAEESGLIKQIGEWVLNKACAQNVEWIKKGYKPVKMSVNISAHQFKNEKFIQNISTILKNTGLDPAFLDLEITESISMYDVELIISILEQIKSLGLSISIDDFGTGHSSISYLKRFPIDNLKIDKSFIFGLQNDNENQAIVKSIISMAHGLGMKVVAEGVEIGEELELLKSYHCDFAQGYYYGKPMPAKNFEKLLKEA